MQNPLKNLSRPKALGLAGAAAGVLAMSGAAAAMNVGLLSSGAAKPFSPQPISLIEDQPTTTTVATEPEIVYEDVYETVPAPSVPGVAPAAPRSDSVSGDDDQGQDDADYDDDDQGTHDDSAYDDDDDHDSDHESEDADHEQSEDHGEDD